MILGKWICDFKNGFTIKEVEKWIKQLYYRTHGSYSNVFMAAMLMYSNCFYTALKNY